MLNHCRHKSPEPYFLLKMDSGRNFIAQCKMMASQCKMMETLKLMGQFFFSLKQRLKPITFHRLASSATITLPYLTPFPLCLQLFRAVTVCNAAFKSSRMPQTLELPGVHPH